MVCLLLGKIISIKAIDIGFLFSKDQNIYNMNKKITLVLLVGIFVFAFGNMATAQKKSSKEKTEVAKEAVPLSEKMKNPEKYNPTPQTVKTKVSKNPTNKRTVAEEIRDLKVVIARLEAKEEKLPFEEKRLTQLKKQLAEKEKVAKK